jgi:L,D-transpeptidase ErfK/SrfK
LADPNEAVQLDVDHERMNTLRTLLIAAALLPATSGEALASNAGEQAKRILKPDSELVGSVKTVVSREEDTLIDIARAHGLGYLAIRNANPGLDAWIPKEGTEVVLPRRHILPRQHRSGIVVNLPEMRLYDFTAGKDHIMTYAVSIGRMDWGTPVGTLKVIQKTERPTWTPPASVRQVLAEQGEILPPVVPPGPDNPLGEFAMRLSNPSYLIHGTNWPDGIGIRATHGCIRLGPEDIEHLFGRIPVGTPVHMINEPVKAGWDGDTLYLEAHPVLEELQEPNNLTPAVRAVVAATGARPAEIDWNAVTRIANARTGIPAAVGRARTAADEQTPPAPVEIQTALAPAATPAAAPGPRMIAAEVIEEGWYVQLGSFGDAGNARRLALRLEEAGFTVHLAGYRSAERAMTRVLVGPEQSAEDARALIALLERAVGAKGHLLNLQPPGE